MSAAGSSNQEIWATWLVIGRPEQAFLVILSARFIRRLNVHECPLKINRVRDRELDDCYEPSSSSLLKVILKRELLAC